MGACNTDESTSTVTSVRLPTELLKRARKQGLNISKITEAALTLITASPQALNPKKRIENMAVVVQLGKTSASHADDPGSNPGDRTIKDYNA